MAEWGATAELARYHYDRRAAGTGEAEVWEVWEVLGDVERTMRSSASLPHTAPRIDDIAVLLTLIGEAEDAYQRLIGEHLEHAERVLAEHVAAWGDIAAGEG